MNHDANIPQSPSGPFRPTTWSLGGIPKKDVDIPVTAVFLFLYIIGAATHMTIFQYNKRRGHKFLFNGMMFGESTYGPLPPPQPTQSTHPTYDDTRSHPNASSRVPD